MLNRVFKLKTINLKCQSSPFFVAQREYLRYRCSSVVKIFLHAHFIIAYFLLIYLLCFASNKQREKQNRDQDL